MGKENKTDEIDFVKWFSELSNKDVSSAGGKGASLAEMYNAKIPVPPGFVLTAQAYSYFLRKTNLDEKISEILKKTKVDNTAELNRASKEIRQLIENQTLPAEIQSELTESYEILSAGKDHQRKSVSEILEDGMDEAFVAVRSSATTEDLADASFAGQQETFLNVKGKEELLSKVKKCISSLFTPRAIYYREKKGFSHESAKLSVVIQKMIDSEKSGVMFSQNPTSNDKNIVIEAVWGLGEGIVSGKIKPDNYVVSSDLDNFEILKTEVANKKIAIVKDEEGKNVTIKLERAKANEQVLTAYEIKVLAQLANKLEEHYKKPQDIEFAISDEGIFIVQSRPITTQFKKSDVEVSGDVLLSGLTASPGVASGKVRIIKELSELEKIQEGDVLVTEMTNPDMVVSMQKSSAIVTDEGGITSHAAIVSREMGIPAVVGTGNATSVLKEGQEVTVDGSSGKVYAGKGETKLIQIEPVVQTKTEIKVIVDLPEAAERAARSGVKGIGLVRLEGIIAFSGKHPFYFVQKKNMSGYVEMLSKGLKKISEQFEEIWIRTSDLRSDEYNQLDGAPKQEEGNPMLGDHGIRFSLKHPGIIKGELLAVKEVADDFPRKKFGVMIPQVISVEEVKKTKAIAEEVSLPKNIEIGIMIETPAAVQIIEELCKEGIAFISFGTNDLTQYTLAVDRNNEEVQDIFDETHPAVLKSLKKVIEVCKRYKVKTSICGQAGSRENMAKFLVENGINSISVNADSAGKISKYVAQLEHQDYNNAEQRIETPDYSSPTPKKENSEKLAKDYAGTQPEKYENNMDIEEAVLAALEEDEYSPSFPAERNKEIPSLNESIPITSGTIDEHPEEQGENIEEVIEEELEKEIVDEWKGENQN